jgi:outer membrane protein assembly factor BamA
MSATDGPLRSVADTNAHSKFRSSEDGALDVSEFIDQTYGFVPMVIPITEPAVGFGAAGGLMFIDKPKGESQTGYGRPNITVVGGLATENGTKGVMVGDVRYWMGDRLQTQAGFAYASVNLDFYGIGKDKTLNNHPLTYNLEPAGGMVGAKYRIEDSRFWAGLSYAFANTRVTFDAPAGKPGLPDFQRESQVGGLTPSLTYDSRNNIFTPTQGTYVEASTGLFSSALGGDDEFQRVNVTAMQFLPLHKELTLGVRSDVILSSEDTPFYMRPFVNLRGTQAMRYQGDDVAQIEGELRWQFLDRFSLVGFSGYGAAWNDLERYNKTLTATTGGVGFRYELARKYGLHMGMDVAFGPDAPIIYIQFGSAWMRP